VDEMWKQAQEHLASNRRDEAKEEMRAILKDHPNYIQSTMSLVELLIGQGGHNVAEAIGVLDKGLSVYPDNTSLLVLKGAALQAGGKFNEAMDAFDAVLELVPAAPAPLLGKAQVCTVQGRHDEALALSDRVAASVVPILALAYTNKSMVYVKTGQFGEALEWAGKALSLDPRQGQALVAKGTALACTGRFSEAIKAYDAVGPQDPARSIAMQNRELAQAELEKTRR